VLDEAESPAYATPVEAAADAPLVSE